MLVRRPPDVVPLPSSGVGVGVGVDVGVGLVVGAGVAEGAVVGAGVGVGVGFVGAGVVDCVLPPVTSSLVSDWSLTMAR